MKIAIIGGGASGLACAIEAMHEAKRKNKKISVTVFESNDRVGKKILATGNGRCNMTNLDSSLNAFFGKDAFMRSALEKYTPHSNIAFFNSLGLYTKADSEGRVYPLSNQAASVLDALRFECERLGVTFRCGETVNKIAKRGSAYIINNAQTFDKVVFACGGKAAVKQHNGYDLLASLGHSVTKTSASLVKLITPSPVTKQLKGIRAAVEMTLLINSKVVASENGELLFATVCFRALRRCSFQPMLPDIFKKARPAQPSESTLCRAWITRSLLTLSGAFIAAKKRLNAKTCFRASCRSVSGRSSSRLQVFRPKVRLSS